MDPMAVMAERTARFPSMATTAVEAVAWSQRWRRSGMVQFIGTAVHTWWTVWFLGTTMVWRRSGFKDRAAEGFTGGPK
jgi:hypothetical protein